jgi:hypothetical protein
MLGGEAEELISGIDEMDELENGEGVNEVCPKDINLNIDKTVEYDLVGDHKLVD